VELAAGKEKKKRKARNEVGKGSGKDVEEDAVNRQIRRKGTESQQPVLSVENCYR